MIEVEPHPPEIASSYEVRGRAECQGQGFLLEGTVFISEHSGDIAEEGHGIGASHEGIQ
jgi:hypothetical protein